MAENEAAAQKLAVARLRAVHERPYLSTALYALIPREAKDVGTMAVDRWWRLYYSPQFIEQHTVEELTGVLYHEVGHLLRDHSQRCEQHGFEHTRWNVAGDMEINDDLELESVKLPGGIFPHTFGFRNGQLAEQYYEALEKFVIKVPATGAGPGKCGSGAGDAPGPWESGPPQGGKGSLPGISASEAEIIRGIVAKEVLDAASGRGTVPAGLRRWAQARLKPQVSWKKELAALIRSNVAHAMGAVDYSYQRPSRRQAALPQVVLPRLVRPVPLITVVIDTSGSMSEKQVSQAVAEVGGVLTALGNRDGVKVLSCDAAASKAKEVFRPEQIELMGGGGTDMRIGIEDALKTKPRPHAIIVITDGFTPWPDRAPPATKIIVCLCGSGTSPPWARTVKVEIESEERRRFPGFPGSRFPRQQADP